MVQRLARCTGALMLLALVFSSAGCAPRIPGVAVVVGNAHYAHSPALSNPENDARALSNRLEELGWAVALSIDPSKAELEASIRSLDGKLRASDKALFFYAGHGMQINGRNYLLPVDFNPTRPIDLDRDMIGIDQTLAQMKRPNNQLAVFLDACRDNPFEDRIVRIGGKTRGFGLVPKRNAPRSANGMMIGRGLAEVEASAGTFIAYATQPGAVALDGTGKHSPFTDALLRYFTENNKDVGWVLQRVRNDVIKETKGAQVPWDHSSLTERYMINARQKRPPPP